LGETENSAKKLQPGDGRRYQKLPIDGYCPRLIPAGSFAPLSDRKKRRNSTYEPGSRTQYPAVAF
jgi:hypothetical protein